MQFPTLAFFDHLEDLIVAFLANQIFLAPILLLFIEEAGIPLPTSDFVIAYTGYEVARGRISFAIAFLILLIADLAGASILYYLCSHYGASVIHKFGKYIDLDEEKLTTVEKQFRKYGVWAIIFGRHITGFRLPITIFAGISEITYPTFIISTFISVVIWITFYLIIGERLGPKTVQLVHANLWYLVLLILPIIISITPFLLLRKKRK
ncbi:MAG TPA: DedA family protein [Patescibacteria group bacterium]|nr:DedA family protein [Patescibacteria group bacterium]